jgi:hypothetical protein
MTCSQAPSSATPFQAVWSSSPACRAVSCHAAVPRHIAPRTDLNLQGRRPVDDLDTRSSSTVNWKFSPATCDTVIRWLADFQL